MNFARQTPTLIRLALAFVALISLSSNTTAEAQKKGKGTAKKPAAAKKATSNNKSKSQAKSKKPTRAKHASNRSSATRNRRGRASNRQRAMTPAQRRRQAAARRRAEQARLAAIARQRAADQALRNEAAANIAKDDPTGEDLEVRRISVAALKGRAGTIVVMNPKTGQVYTVVNQDWAIRRGFKPCSTIKLVTSLAGLNEQVIETAQTVKIADNTYNLDLTDSLAYSNNGYFQSVGGQVGFEKMMRYARELGLGARTGINHVLESPGRLPVSKNGFGLNRMSSHGDDFEVTPIQLATMVSAISNGGNIVVPRLPRTPEETFRFKGEVRRKVNIPEETLRRVVPGMIGAVSYGTGRGAYDPVQTIAGKTGSCIGQGGWLGLFGSYGPVVDPQLAVVVVTRGSGERGRTAASIAGEIYRSLNQRFGRPSVQFARTPDIPVPTPKIDPKIAAAISDEESEGDSGAGTVTDTAAPPRSNPVKSVIMTMPARPNESTRPASKEKQSGAGENQQRPRRVQGVQP